MQPIKTVMAAPSNRSSTARQDCSSSRRRAYPDLLSSMIPAPHAVLMKSILLRSTPGRKNDMGLPLTFGDGNRLPDSTTVKMRLTNGANGHISLSEFPCARAYGQPATQSQ